MAVTSEADLYERLGRYVELTLDSHDRAPYHDLEASIRRGVAMVKAGRWETAKENP